MYFRNQFASPKRNTHVGLVLVACRYCPLLGQQLKSDECLYWGGTSFTTARPLVPATRVVRRFSLEIAKNLARRARGTRVCTKN